MSCILGEWREGKVRPLPGNAPRGPAGKPGNISALEHFATIPSAPLDSPRHRTLPEPSVGVFKAWRNLSGPIRVQNQTNLWVGTIPPPDGRPRTQGKERAGRITLFLIVRR